MLISVLWMVGIIAAVAAGFTLSVQIYIRSSASARQSASLEETANGLVRLVSFGLAERLAAEREPTPWASGRPYRCAPRENVSALVAIQDQAGLIDLNAASPDLLGLAIGAVAPERGQAAAAIVDFRDGDDEPTRPGGAETEAYRLAGKPYGPKNGPFHIAAEVDQVLGLEGDPAEMLLPYVTVYGFHNGVDPAVAPKHLAGLLGEHPEIALLQSPRQFFGIDVIVSTVEGGRFHRQAIVALSRDSGRPFRIIEWSRGQGTFREQPDEIPAASPDCLPPRG